MIYCEVRCEQERHLSCPLPGKKSKLLVYKLQAGGTKTQLVPEEREVRECLAEEEDLHLQEGGRKSAF
jgi:hypothetical protein